MKITRSELASFDLEPLRRFVRERILPDASRRDRESVFPTDLFRGLHDLGILQAFIPEEQGGLGTPATDLAWIFRELAFGSRGITTSLAAHVAAITGALRFAPAPLAAMLAERLLSQAEFASFCWTEPDSGSDVLRIQTKAERVPGGYRLSGKKCFISNASHADHFFIVARHPDLLHPRKALSLFYVPATEKGLTTGKPLDKLGHREANTGEVYLDQIFVPESHRIGDEGEGVVIAQLALQRSRTMFAASAVGLMDRAIELATQHLQERSLYEKPLITQPVIRSCLAQLHVERRAAWLLTRSAAESWDAGLNATEHACMAKYYAGHAAARIASQALELLGGYGYSREFELERLYRDAKLYSIIEGPSFVLEAMIAKEVIPPAAQESAKVISLAEGRKKAA